MVPINTLVKLRRTYGSETVSRYNMFNSISVNAIRPHNYDFTGFLSRVNSDDERHRAISSG